MMRRTKRKEKGKVRKEVNKMKKDKSHYYP